MPNKKGFTLTEIIVVMVIAGIILAIAIPSYLNSVQQGAANAAQNNLTAIYNAEKTYYLNNGTYCTGSCASSLANINTNLALNLTDGGSYTYSCTASGSNFSCEANGSSSASYYSCGGTGVAQNSTPVNGTCTTYSSICSSSCPYSWPANSIPGEVVTFQTTGLKACIASTPAQCGGTPASAAYPCPTTCRCTYSHTGNTYGSTCTSIATPG